MKSHTPAFTPAKLDFRVEWSAVSDKCTVAIFLAYFLPHESNDFQDFDCSHSRHSYIKPRLKYAFNGKRADRKVLIKVARLSFFFLAIPANFKPLISAKKAIILKLVDEFSPNFSG